MSKSARNRAQRNVLTAREVPWGGIAFFTLIAVGAVAAITYAFLQTRSSDDPIAGLVEKDGLSREHTTGQVEYASSPPMGGDHNPRWQGCDAQVYDQPVPDENAVHSLEHGAVWITYRPGLAADQIEDLAGTVRGTGYTMLSPYPGQDSPITLTAWGKQLKLDDASDPRVDRFLRAYVQGPQTPEPGASCTGAGTMQ